MKIATALYLTLACLASGSALALPIPQGDIDYLCRQNLGGKNSRGTLAEQHARCFDYAQEAYAKLKPKWGTISESEQKTCIEKTYSFSTGTYSELLRCIENIEFKRAREAEQNAAARERAAIPKREFRY